MKKYGSRRNPFVKQAKKIARAELRIAKKTLNCCRVSGNVYSSKAIQRLGG
jgi:hypothetical protein